MLYYLVYVEIYGRKIFIVKLKVTAKNRKSRFENFKIIFTKSVEKGLIFQSKRSPQQMGGATNYFNILKVV